MRRRWKRVRRQTSTSDGCGSTKARRGKLWAPRTPPRARRRPQRSSRAFEIRRSLRPDGTDWLPYLEGIESPMPGLCWSRGQPDPECPTLRQGDRVELRLIGVNRAGDRADLRYCSPNEPPKRHETIELRETCLSDRALAAAAERRWQMAPGCRSGGSDTAGRACGRGGSAPGSGPSGGRRRCSGWRGAPRGTGRRPAARDQVRG